MRKNLQKISASTTGLAMLIEIYAILGSRGTEQFAKLSSVAGVLVMGAIGLFVIALSVKDNLDGVKK